MTIILGPIALIGIAIDKRYKDRPNYALAVAVIRFGIISAVCIAMWVGIAWLVWHHQFGWGNWTESAFAVVFSLQAGLEWKQVRLRISERRQARAIAQAEDNKPSEFHYASERPE